MFSFLVVGHSPFFICKRCSLITYIVQHILKSLSRGFFIFFEIPYHADRTQWYRLSGLQPLDNYIIAQWAQNTRWDFAQKQSQLFVQVALQGFSVLKCGSVTLTKKLRGGVKILNSACLPANKLLRFCSQNDEKYEEVFYFPIFSIGLILSECNRSI